MTQAYTALVERGESMWTATVQGLPNGQNAVAMGNSWKRLRGMVQEMCEHILGLPSGSVAISLELSDPELQALIDEARVAKAVLRGAQSNAQATLERALRTLSRTATVRDMAEMLGYSHQYIARKAPKNTLKEEPGDTPRDYARMLYLVAGVKTPASREELAREARAWVKGFPEDPDFLGQVVAEHRALIKEMTDASWTSPTRE